MPKSVLAAGGGVPNGKLSGLSEPLGWLRLLPPGPRKVLCLRRAQHQHGCETLADYYVCASTGFISLRLGLPRLIRSVKPSAG